MKSLLPVVLVGVALGGMIVVDRAEAGDKRRGGRGTEIRYSRQDDRYFRGRDVVVIREYYRPYYRPLPPGLRHRYQRAGYLPPGWARRMRPLPVYVERELVVVPRGYRRGLIDGHAASTTTAGSSSTSPCCCDRDREDLEARGARYKGSS